MEAKNKTEEEAQCNKVFRCAFQRPLYTIVFIAIVISGTIYAIYRSGEASRPSTENMPQPPVTNPLLEPDRPDLIGGGARIDEERQ